MSYMDMKNAISLADKHRREIVLCFIGIPGIGKTHAVYEFARENNRNVVEIIASQILPSEVSGITMPDEETQSMAIFDHARLSSLKDGDILFFDELLQASPQVLSACLTLIQERRLMSGKMLPDILIVAAANPVSSATIPWQIRQRFMFFDCSVDKEELAKYLIGKFNLNIEHFNSIKSFIEKNIVNSDEGRWNQLSPRSLTKLVGWYDKIKDDVNSKVQFRYFVNNMFDYGIASGIERMFAKTKKDKVKETVIATIKENAPDYLKETIKRADFDDMEEKDLLPFIQSIDNSGKIIEALKNMDLYELEKQCIS